MPDAMASPIPRTPSVAIAPPTDATVRKSRLPLFNVSVIASSLVNRSNAGVGESLAASPTSGKALHHSHRGSQLVLFGWPLVWGIRALADVGGARPPAPHWERHQAKLLCLSNEFPPLDRLASGSVHADP